MKKLIILMLFCGIFASCKDKDYDDLRVATETSRVKSITGYDSHWGDYTMSMKYQGNILDSIIIRDNTGKKIGHAYSSESNNTLTYTFIDLVPTISQQEIDILIEEHGAEGAGEHIPMVERTYRIINILYWKDAVQSQTFVHYRPRDNTGGEFDSRYIIDRSQHNIYEYDSSGRIVICRTINDIYDHEVSEGYFVRDIRKFEVAFGGSQVNRIGVYRAENDSEIEESYIPEDSYIFNYNSGLLGSISGGLLQMNYTYSGTRPISITTNDRTFIYQHNSDGLVSRMSYSDDAYAEITYESGTGNMKLLSPLFEALLGIPVVQ